MSRNHDDFETVDLLELVSLGIRRAGHAGELLVKPEIVLERDRRYGLILFLDAHALLGLDRLMQTIGPASPGHRSPGELVDDHDLAVRDDVVDLALEQSVRAERRIQVVHQTNVARVVKALPAF